MGLDEIQSAWQSHDHGQRLTIDVQLLLKEVRRNHRAMEVELRQRDFGEIFAAVIVAITFGSMAIVMREWSLWIAAAGGIFVGLFFIVDRIGQYRRRISPGETLQTCIQASLAQVEHQIWLLKNVLWWYLLPLIPGPVAFLVSISWQSREEGIGSQIVIGTVGMICVIGFWLAYKLNQQAVERTFVKRRNELKALQESLNA